MDVRVAAHPRPRVPQAVPLVDLPDEVLVDRARDGDTRAFDALLRRHQRIVFAVALRITASRPDAEDAVQAGLLTAWRRLPGFRGDAAFGTWLHRIVTNQALTLVRRRRDVDPLPDAATLVPPSLISRAGDRPDAEAQRAALATALSAALTTLPDDLRVVWVLREVDGCSYEEVAGIVGESHSTVRGRIARARQVLAASMAEWR